jgi:hypothetical protein
LAQGRVTVTALMAAPLAFESPLIITYGRTGSTLLQGLLNSIDGFVVRGENHNFCYHLYQAAAALGRSKWENAGEAVADPAHPWYGAGEVSAARFLDQVRPLIRAQLLGNADPTVVRCLGFKEVRYTVPDLRRYLDFLWRVMPRPAFIVLTRDHEEVVKSGWWASKDPAAIRPQLIAFERVLHEFAEGKHCVFRLDYRDLVERTERLRELFTFLGAHYDAAQVDGIVATRHSYGPASRERDLTVTHVPDVSVAFLSMSAEAVPIGTAEKFTLRGALVLQGSAAQSARLAVRDAEGEKPVTWGIASPWLSEGFPGNSQAARAAFRVDGVVIARGGQATLLLAQRQGGWREVAEARLAADVRREPA